MEAEIAAAQDAPPNFTSHKVLSRKRPGFNSNLSTNAQTSRDRGTDSFAVTEATQRAQTPLGSAILSDGDGTLPPTPPSTSRDAVQHSGLASSRQKSGSMKALSCRRSGLSTPTTARSPPTPDITPPSEQRLRKPIPSPLMSLSTSRAESFQTAREEPAAWSSEDDTDIGYPEIGAYQPTTGVYQASTKAYSEATRALRFSDRGLGFDFEHEDGDLTPTKSPTAPLHSPLLLPKLRGTGTHVRSTSNKDNDGKSESIDDWNDTQMRNVTQHRAKRPRSPLGGQQQQLDGGAEAPGLPERISNSPVPLQSISVLSAPQVMDVAKARVVSEPSHVLHRNIRSIDPKRLSDPLSNSAVVEAVIRIATPPNTKRTLRHVTKHTGLRSLSSSTIELAQVALTTSNGAHRHPLGSSKVPLHTLHHKRASVGDKVHETILVGDDAAVPRRRPLRHSRDYSHLRPNTGSSTNSATPFSDHSLNSHRETTDLRLQAPAVIVTSTSKGSHSPITPHATSPFTETPNIVGQFPSPGETSLGADASLKPAPTKSVLKTRPEKLELGPFPFSQDPLLFTPGHAPSPSTIESQNHLMPVVPPQMLQQTTAARARHSANVMDFAEDSRRVSFGRDALSAPEPIEHAHRRSLDSRRSTAYTFDDSNSTHGYGSLYPPVTPISMSSMRSEAQIAEATAINLYPHTNESLLFVQHGISQIRSAKDNAAYPQLNGSPVPTADLHRAIDAIENAQTPTPPPTRVTTTAETEDILHLTPPSSAGRGAFAPQLLVEPCTPTTAVAPSEVDSPLRNPRSAPQPPAFKVIPPTPFSEIGDPLNQHAPAAAQPQVFSQAPARRISLMQRARRYSDSFIQPLFTRTVSVKRVSRPMTSDAPSRDLNLHPFWRPRGFWDDYSDSESDDEFWGDGELMHADDMDSERDRRLPQGGDTSDVRSLEQQRPVPLGRMGSVKKVIVDGFKSSGGFLIGNSLGMERAGTNRRRHQITLPARLQGRYAPNRGVATLPAYVVDKYGATSATHHVARQSALPPTTQGLGPSSGFTHNPTEPLSVRSAPSVRTPSRSVSLSSFPSSYTSTRGSRRRAGWRRNMQFPFRIEYVGIRGMAERMRERKAEKRRDDLRRQIGRGVLQQNEFGTLKN